MVDTYFSFLVKNIARLALQAYAGGALGTTPLTTVANLQGEALRRELEKLESGGIFSTLGLKNLLEGDFFSWYLDIWTGKVAAAVRGVIRALADFEPATPVLEPDWTRDLLQKLYELLVPRILRHGLGEYYTPDWLAGYLIDKAGYRGGLEERFLDPSCGSGTFLVHAIHKASRHAEKMNGPAAAETGQAILNNIMGFEKSTQPNYVIFIYPVTYRPNSINITFFQNSIESKINIKPFISIKRCRMKHILSNCRIIHIRKNRSCI